MDQPLTLSIELASPPAEASPEILAAITLSTDAHGVKHSGDLLHNPVQEEEAERLRWYLEEYWKWPYEQFRERAEEIEALLPEIGHRLYQAIFGSAGAQRVLQAWRLDPGRERQISIVSDIPRVLSLPWELLHDEQGFFALRARHPVSIARRLSLEELPAFSTPFTPPLRILLITARPDDAGFVDPRGIARELVEEVAPQVQAGTIALEFLRPPTLSALRARLGDGKRPPVHVLHFDGHGAFGDVSMPQDGLRLRSSGARGMLAFENEEGKQELVSAEELAQVLQDSGVRLAVFNACQSAQGAMDDVFSSVAARLLKGGIDAVVAMSASVLVASATHYVEAFYHALAQGEAVPLAHERARQALHDDPRRHLSRRFIEEEGEPVRLSDWWLPHYYQQRPLLLEPTASALTDYSPTRTRKRPYQDASLPVFNEEMPVEPRYGFSGRSRELLEIERALLQKKLVVIHGFGGMGKTALAREAADWFTRTGFYQRACFVSFEQGGDAVLLLGALGRFLGIYDGAFHPNDLPTALTRIQQALRKQRVLVLADNLESILPEGEAPLSSDLRTQLWQVLLALRKQGTGVLLTSRDTGFGGSQLAPGKDVLQLWLEGLWPEDAYLLASSILTDLGIDRARAPYTELRALLAQLDHHPLAIQLVLPTLRDHPLSRIRAEFATLLPNFVDDTVSGRNRSLLASLNYSLRRLDAEQRALLSRLAVFEGGAGEDDLLAITEIPVSVWASLRRELEQAALLVVESVHPAIRVSFLHFHPVLVPSLHSEPGADQDVKLRQRYARRYYAVVNYLYNQYYQYPEPVLALIRRELPNLRHALAFLFEEGLVEEAARMTEYLARFLTNFGMLRELKQRRARLTRAMAERGASAEGTLTQAEYVHEFGLAEDERQRGNVRAAFARLSSLLARIQAQPAEKDIGPGSFPHCHSLNELGRCLRQAGQPAAAEARFREALAVLERLLERKPEDEVLLREHANLFGDLGTVLMFQGKYAQAREALEQALKELRAMQETRNVAVAFQRLGILAQEQKEYVEARTYLLQALEQFENIGEPAAKADTWYSLGTVAQDANDLVEAERCLRESLALYERLGNVVGAADCCNVLADVANRAGRPGEAEGWYKGALERIEQVEPGGISHAIYLHNLADLLVTEVQAGRAPKIRLVEAHRYAEQALHFVEQPEVSAEQWKTFSILAQIAELEEDQEAARGYRRRERESFAAFAGNRAQMDQQHGSLIAAIAQAAQGNEEQRTRVEEVLPQLEQAGWHIRAAIEHIWKGERDWHTLIDELDRQEALLILRVLETLEAPPKSAPPEEETQDEEGLLASLPPAIREALVRGDEAAFRQAFEALALEEQQQVAALLDALQRQREVAAEEQDDPETSFLSQVEPLLQAIALAASGDAAQRHEIERVLADLEAQGWHLQEAVARLWAGEREVKVLTDELDEQDSALIARVLELLSEQDSATRSQDE